MSIFPHRGNLLPKALTFCKKTVKFVVFIENHGNVTL